MAKRVHYIYNPSTDNFERYYPSLRSRVATLGRYLLFGGIFALILVWLLHAVFGFNNDSYVKDENRKLKQEVKRLDGKVNESLAILGDIRARDDNFYRVMLQMEPMNLGRRYAGLGLKDNYSQYQGLSNSEVMVQLNRNIDLLDRQLYAQSQSFDELRTEALKQRNKIDHVPAILPLESESFTISSGYGYRVDPVYGGTRFHPGIDFMTPVGSAVYATASGVCTKATSVGTSGNCVEIDHGFNYKTRYAHLSTIDIAEGDHVARGDIIGQSGNTGKSTAPHLHYEVRFKDEPVDPVNYYFLEITPEQYRDFMSIAANAGNMMD